MKAPYRLPPSSAYRWTNCAIAVRAAQDYPEPPEGDEAREGTCAAWVAQCVFNGEAATCADMIGKTHPINAWLVTADMARDVQGFVDVVHKRGGTTVSEGRVSLCDFPWIEGTTDLYATKGSAAILYVDDLKYGRKIVEPRRNPQLLIYAGAILREYDPGTFNVVQLGIYQPRAYHHNGIYRKWVVSVAELQQMCDQIISAGRNCYLPSAQATPGDWCEYCPVASRCEALAHTNYARLSLVASAAHRDMTAVELSRELDFLAEADATLTARRKAVEAEADARARREPIPGYALRPTYGKRKFNVPPAIVQAMTGVDPFEKKPCTPAELIRRGASETAVKALSVTPATGNKLVKVTPDDIAAAFGE